MNSGGRVGRTSADGSVMRSRGIATGPSAHSSSTKSGMKKTLATSFAAGFAAALIYTLASRGASLDSVRRSPSTVV